MKPERDGAIAEASAETSAIRPDSRIPALDGLRGVASLAVLLYHFGPHIARESASPFMFLHAIPPLWFEGVDLFFVLSGFLISGILADARDSPRYFQTFYARRCFRIFPLYYLVLASYAIVIAALAPDSTSRLFENPLPVWTYVLYLQNFAMAKAGTFGPVWMAGSWSLAVEEQFYLTLPAINRRVSDRGLFYFALLGVVSAPVVRALIQRFKFVPALTNYVTLPTRVDSLAVGVLVMLLIRHRRVWLTKYRGEIGWGAVGLFTLWSLYPYVPNSQAIRLGFLNYSANAIVFGAILLALLAFPLGAPARLLSKPLMRTIGNMAYSTYLFHPILLCLVFRAMRSKDPDLMSVQDLFPLLVAGLITMALSWLSWSQFETRLLRIGHRFQY